LCVWQRSSARPQLPSSAQIWCVADSVTCVSGLASMHAAVHNVMAAAYFLARMTQGLDTAPPAGAPRSHAWSSRSAKYPRSDEGAVAAAVRQWNTASRDIVATLRHAADVDGDAEGEAAVSLFAQAVAVASRRLQAATALLATSGTTPPCPVSPDFSAADMNASLAVPERHSSTWQTVGELSPPKGDVRCRGKFSYGLPRR